MSHETPTYQNQPQQEFAYTKADARDLVELLRDKTGAVPMPPAHAPGVPKPDYPPTVPARR